MPLPFILPFTPLTALLFTWIMMSIVPIAGRLMTALGVGFVTFLGMDFLFGQLQTRVLGSFVGLDASIVAMVGLTRIDSAVSMVISAMSIKLVMKLAGQTSQKVFRLRA